ALKQLLCAEWSLSQIFRKRRNQIFYNRLFQGRWLVIRSSWAGGLPAKGIISLVPSIRFTNLTAAQQSVREWEEFYQNHETYKYVGKLILPPIDPDAPLPPSDCSK